MMPPVSDPTLGRRRWRKRLAFLITMVAVSYLGVLVLLLALENAMLFYPIRASQEWLPPPNPRVQDLELHAADGTLIHAWWCPTEDWDQSQGAVLYCHGNAGNLSHWSGAITTWQKQMNTAVLIFDYPGYGRSGGKPSEAGCYAAADAAYRWLTETKKVSPLRVVIFGISLGGGVAVDLASRRPHRALVLDRTFTSIPDMAQRQFPWLPARWLVRNRFDNLGKIGRCTRPVFMAHGTADVLIPLSQGERLFAAANEPKEFFAIPGHGHDDLVPPEFFDRLRHFLAEASP